MENRDQLKDLIAVYNSMIDEHTKQLEVCEWYNVGVLRSEIKLLKLIINDLNSIIKQEV